jgi:hypothetical protein
MVGVWGFGQSLTLIVVVLVVVSWLLGDPSRRIAPQAGDSDADPDAN